MEKPDKNILEINLNKLEENCKEQPKLSYDWGMALVEAKKRLRDSKKQLKLVAAQLEQKIRSTPDMFGLEKVTDKSVESTILLQDEYQNADAELSQMEYEEDVLDLFFKCLNDRKGELDILSGLFANMYWSKPSEFGKTRDSKAGTVAKMTKANKNVV